MSAAYASCEVTRVKGKLYMSAVISNGEIKAYAAHEFLIKQLLKSFPGEDYESAMMIGGYARLIREFAERYNCHHLLSPQMITGFKTSNRLTYWEHSYPLDPDFTVYHLGSCHGMYIVNTKLNTIDLVAIMNNAPGSGHLNDVFEYFEDACKRYGFNLRVTSFFNPEFRTHLITKRGFAPDGEDVIKIIPK